MAAATKIVSVKWISMAAGTVFLVLVMLLLAGRDRVPQARVARVVRQNIAATIASNGKVEPIEPFVLHAQFATFVDSVYATEGQAVKLGQPILTLDSADVRAQLAQVRADLVAAQQIQLPPPAAGEPDQLAQLSGDIRKAEIDVQTYEHMRDSLQQLVKEHAATQDENCRKMRRRWPARRLPWPPCGSAERSGHSFRPGCAARAASRRGVQSADCFAGSKGAIRGGQCADCGDAVFAADSHA